MTTPIYNITDTWNDAAVVFDGFKMTITDTLYSAGSLMIDVSSAVAGGSFTVDVDGNVVISGSLTTGTPSVTAVTVVSTATYDLLTADDVLHVTRTATGACAITLKTDQVIDGRKFTLKDAATASVNNITIDTEGAELIDGAATVVISSDLSALGFYCDGTNWFIH